MPGTMTGTCSLAMWVLLLFHLADQDVEAQAQIRMFKVTKSYGHTVAGLGSKPGYVYLHRAHSFSAEEHLSCPSRQLGLFLP